MEPMNRKAIQTRYGEKYISVYHCGIAQFPLQIDVLTTSAFRGSYSPTPRTLFEALHHMGIHVAQLAQHPLIDLRELSNVWLSKPIGDPRLPIGHIGCVEMSSHYDRPQSSKEAEEKMLQSIRTYFRMLEIAISHGIPIRTLALPLLGTGRQMIREDMVLIPLLSECVSFLERNEEVKEIYFIDRNPSKAYAIASALDVSYAVRNRSLASVQPSDAIHGNAPMAFISHSSAERNIVMNLCAKLEARGMKVWYAPRNILSGDYASSIVNAIASCTHFILVMSKNSLASQHVLNEIDLAFGKLGSGKVSFHLLRLDDGEMEPAFQYYLTRQHWMDARLPPLEERLEAFVDSVLC